MFGLRADLVKCLVYIMNKEGGLPQTTEESSVIPDFVLGGCDLSVALHFVPRLCGREHQTRLLRQAIENTIEGKGSSKTTKEDESPTVVLVGGTAGTGKSMLVTSTVHAHAQNKV